MCPKCSEVVRAQTAIGVRIAMRYHRKHTCPKRGERKGQVSDEPPEEFDRDSVGEPEEFDPELARELAEMLESEQIDELADDMLLDEIGRGEDHRLVTDNYSDAEWQLQDDLHDIHEQPDDEPIPELVDREEAKRIIAEAKKKYDEKKAAEGLGESKGAENVTISDDAQRLAQIGNNEEAIGAIAEAAQDIANAQQALSQAGEALGAAVQKMQAAAQKAGGDAAEAGGLLGGSDGENIQGQGLTVAEQIGNSMQHIGQIDLAAAEASLQQANLEGVGNQTQALYQAIKDAAARHQG